MYNRRLTCFPKTITRQVLISARGIEGWVITIPTSLNVYKWNNNASRSHWIKSTSIVFFCTNRKGNIIQTSKNPLEIVLLLLQKHWRFGKPSGKQVRWILLRTLLKRAILISQSYPLQTMLMCQSRCPTWLKTS